jgi:hypothetical protein
MEKVGESQPWTAVDVWSALIEFDEHASKSENVDSIVSDLSEMVGRPLSVGEESDIRRILNDANPIMWELRIAGPSEDERARVQGEILRILKPR